MFDAAVSLLEYLFLILWGYVPRNRIVGSYSNNSLTFSTLFWFKMFPKHALDCLTFESSYTGHRIFCLMFLEVTVNIDDCKLLSYGTDALRMFELSVQCFLLFLSSAVFPPLAGECEEKSLDLGGRIHISPLPLTDCVTKSKVLSLYLNLLI